IHDVDFADPAPRHACRVFDPYPVIATDDTRLLKLEFRRHEFVWGKGRLTRPFQALRLHKARLRPQLLEGAQEAILLFQLTQVRLPFFFALPREKLPLKERGFESL